MRGLGRESARLARLLPNRRTKNKSEWTHYQRTTLGCSSMEGNSRRKVGGRMRISTTNLSYTTISEGEGPEAGGRRTDANFVH
jgi:hypothetical protein